MQKKYKAALALCISIVGFILTYPYASQGFWSGMVHGGFLAATIGGLADWFAVTALFRRPLGISYRTDILRRNRKRLMQALVTFASEDLLSVQNIMDIVRTQNMAQMLVEYLSLRGGRDRVCQVLDDVLLAAARQIDSRNLAEELAPILRQTMKGFPLERLLLDFIAMLKEKRYNEQLLFVLLRIGRQVLEAQPAQQTLLENIKILRRRYEEQSSGRAFVLQALDLSDEKILAILNRKIAGYLEQLAQPETEKYQVLQEKFVELLGRIAENEALEQTMAGWKEELADRLNLGEPFAALLDEQLKGENPVWLPEVNRLAEKKMQEFAERESWQKRYDTAVKDYMERELSRHHSVITRMIQERLDEFSDDKLVEFIESRIEDDVQMIRINGSVVGSLVGMLLYAIVFFMERVYG